MGSNFGYYLLSAVSFFNKVHCGSSVMTLESPSHAVIDKFLEQFDGLFLGEFAVFIGDDLSGDIHLLSPVFVLSATYTIALFIRLSSSSKNFSVEVFMNGVTDQDCSMFGFLCDASTIVSFHPNGDVIGVCVYLRDTDFPIGASRKDGFMCQLNCVCHNVSPYLLLVTNTIAWFVMISSVIR